MTTTHALPDVEVDESELTTDDSDSLDHIVCIDCNPNRGLCGSNVEDAVLCDFEDDEDTCVVCVEIDESDTHVCQPSIFWFGVIAS